MGFRTSIGGSELQRGVQNFKKGFRTLGVGSEQFKKGFRTLGVCSEQFKKGFRTSKGGSEFLNWSSELQKDIEMFALLHRDEVYVL